MNIYRLAIPLLLLFACLSMQAQDKKRPGCTEKEFRQKQQCYLTQKAGLTQEEAEKFFPVYFELQDRKRQLNEKAFEKARKGKDPQTTEAEYETIIDEQVKVRMEADQLDWEYLQKFKKLIPYKKIYLLQHAEMKFRRDLLKIMHRQPPKKK